MKDFIETFRYFKAVQYRNESARFCWFSAIGKAGKWVVINEENLESFGSKYLGIEPIEINSKFENKTGWM